MTGDLSRRIRLGMVGGGDGSFIGSAHRIAARLDDEFELVAGALSSTPDNAHASARALRIAWEREALAGFGQRVEPQFEAGAGFLWVCTHVNHLLDNHGQAGGLGYVHSGLRALRSDVESFGDCFVCSDRAPGALHHSQ